MNVLSLLCIIYLLYTTMDNDDDSKEKVHHQTKQNTEKEYENTDLQQSTQDILQHKINLFTAQQKRQHAKNIAELEEANIQKHSKEVLRTEQFQNNHLQQLVADQFKQQYREIPGPPKPPKPEYLVGRPFH